MKNETFQKAIKLNDKIDNLSDYIKKLDHAKGNTVKQVQIYYYVGQYNDKCQFILPPEASVFIEEMLLKEIDRVNEEKDKLQDEFNNL